MTANLSTVWGDDYRRWLADLKLRVERARQRAAASANRELVTLYWQIGRDILDRQRRQGWGAVLPHGMMLLRCSRHLGIVLRWRLALRSGASLHRSGLTKDFGNQLPRAV